MSILDTIGLGFLFGFLLLLAAMGGPWAALLFGGTFIAGFFFPRQSAS